MRCGQDVELFDDEVTMNYYCLWENDQPRGSWVLFDLVKCGPKHVRNPELPPAMYQFFGPQPEGEMRMKPEYLPLCCKKCGRYDSDVVFDVGFSEPVSIRVKGDFSHTQDRVLVVNQKLLSVLHKAKVGGYQSKPIGRSGWHALKVSLQVDCIEGVLEPGKPYCKQCGRPDGAAGAFVQINQLDCPRSGNTFFTTRVNYHRRLQDRDIFVTEEVVKAMKEAGIKGGYCNRLWTDDEVRIAEEKAKAGKKWKPPGSTILL